MPASRGRGRARGGGIAGEGRYDESAQGGAEGQEVEDQFMRDRERIEKRKREGRQGGAEGSPPRRDSRFTHDSESASAEATPRKKPSPMATRMGTRSAEKEGRDTNHQAEGSPTPSEDRSSDIPREVTMNDIMQQADQLFSKALTTAEIKKALFSASPDKTAGSDSLTIRV
jgi:hypothetical protein